MTHIIRDNINALALKALLIRKGYPNGEDLIPVHFITEDPKKPKLHANIHKFELPQGLGTLNIVVENNVTKRTSIRLVTTPRVLAELQKYGVTSSQAPTTRGVERGGQYRLMAAKRRIHGNIQSNKDNLKRFINDNFTLHRLALRQIERSIYASVDEQQASFKQYIDRLEQLQAMLQKPLEYFTKVADAGKTLQGNFRYDPNVTLADFKRYYPDVVQALRDNCAHLLAQAQKAQAHLDPEALKAFLRKQLNDIGADAKELNEQITWNATDSIFRGKAQNYYCDSEIEDSGYPFDVHRSIQKEHQLDFTKESTVIYNSDQHLGSDRESLESVLYAICDICSGENPTPEKTVSPAWRNVKTNPEGINFSRMFWSGCCMVLSFLVSSLILGVFNFLEKVLIGEYGVIHHAMEKVEKKLENYFIPEKPIQGFNFARLQKCIGVNKTYFSTLMGNVIHRILAEAFYIVKDGLVKAYESLVHFFKAIAMDVRSGVWGRFFQQSCDDLKKSEIKAAIEEEIQRQTAQWSGLKTQACKINSITSEEFDAAMKIPYAIPLISLKPYAPRGLISEIIKAGIIFTSFFKDEIFNKHPVTALASSAAYVIFGSAVIMPEIMRFFVTQLGFSLNQAREAILALNKVSQAMAAGAFGGAISVGFTAAKLTALAFNFVMGTESWIVRGTLYVRDNTVTVVVGAATAYGLGFALTELPGVKHVLDEEIGSVRPLGQIFLGGKTAVLLVEGATSTEERHSFFSEFFAEIFNLMAVLLRCALSPLSLSLAPWRELWCRHIKQGIGMLLYNLNALLVLAFQCVAMFLKVLTEVVVTLLVFALKVLSFPVYAMFEGGALGLSWLIRAKHDLYRFVDHTFTRPLRDASRWCMQRLGEWMWDDNMRWEQVCTSLELSPSRRVDFGAHASAQEIERVKEQDPPVGVGMETMRGDQPALVFSH